MVRIAMFWSTSMSFHFHSLSNGPHAGTGYKIIDLMYILYIDIRFAMGITLFQFRTGYKAALAPLAFWINCFVFSFMFSLQSRVIPTLLEVTILCTDLRSLFFLKICCVYFRTVQLQFCRCSTSNSICLAMVLPSRFVFGVVLSCN